MEYMGHVEWALSRFGRKAAEWLVSEQHFKKWLKHTKPGTAKDMRDKPERCPKGLRSDPHPPCPHSLL